MKKPLPTDVSLDFLDDISDLEERSLAAENVLTLMLLDLVLLARAEQLYLESVKDRREITRRQRDLEQKVFWRDYIAQALLTLPDASGSRWTVIDYHLKKVSAEVYGRTIRRVR